MFKWFRKLRLKEQQKLFYQNSLAASATLKGYCSGMGDEEALAVLELFHQQTRNISQKVYGDILVSPDELKLLLEINRNLRRLYDNTALKYLGSFDSAHTPDGGWDAYFSGHDFGW